MDDTQQQKTTSKQHEPLKHIMRVMYPFPFQADVIPYDLTHDIVTKKQIDFIIADSPDAYRSAIFFGLIPQPEQGTEYFIIDTQQNQNIIETLKQNDNLKRIAKNAKFYDIRKRYRIIDDTYGDWIYTGEIPYPLQAKLTHYIILKDKLQKDQKQTTFSRFLSILSDDFPDKFTITSLIDTKHYLTLTAIIMVTSVSG